MADIETELRALAAEYQLGGLVNDIDELGKRFGGADRIPRPTWRAVMALWAMLDALDLVDAGRERSAKVWRSR